MKRLGSTIFLGIVSLNCYGLSGHEHQPIVESEAVRTASDISKTSRWQHEEHMENKHRENFSPDDDLCSTGKNQSPVDFSKVADRELDEIVFHYSASPVRAINNGHTLVMNYAPGSYMEIGAKKFHLLQLHFHAPSEHKIEGRHASMEVHLVHKGEDDRLAIVGVMIEEGAGNRSLGGLWRIMPKAINQDVYAEGRMLNVADLLPKHREYFHYQGSLTTPPCSEGVNWFVMQKPISISARAIKKFYSIVGNNSRPVQPLHARIPME